MHRWITVLIVAATTVATASAQTLIVPASANAGGVNNTTWRTDLQVKSLGEADASFTIELLETGANNSSPETMEHTVGAGESFRLGNVLDADFGYTGTAALRLTATDGRIFATSRTFNDDPGGTYGQTVPAVDVDQAFAFGDDAALILLSTSPDPSIGFRTNLGLVNLTDSQISMEIDVYSADGTLLGTINRNLGPFSHRQINDVFDAVGADDVPDGYALVRTVTDGGRFIAYASVVDNGSGDAIFLLGEAELTPTPDHPRLTVFESFLRPG